MRQFIPSKLDIGSIKPTTARFMPKPFVGQTFRGHPSKRTVPSSLGFVLTTFLLLVAVWGLAYVSQVNTVKKEILGSATNAYEELNLANQNLATLDFQAAEDSFSKAVGHLDEARQQLKPLKANLLEGAYRLSLAGVKLSEGLKLFESLKVGASGVDNGDFNQKLRQSRSFLFESFTDFELASEAFSKAEAVPLEYQDAVETAKKQIAITSAVISNLIDLEDLYLSLFGKNYTYLLVFQNYDEARATGGFIGTYGVLRVENGLIKKLRIDSVYNLDNLLTTQIAAPGPLQPDIKQWGLRDANWFADYVESSKKLIYFYEKGSETVDGVIAITPSLFEDLLRLVGPVSMEAYGLTVTSENFQETVQYKTSIDYNKSLNQPKKFLADFAPLLLDRLGSVSHQQWLSLFEILNSNLNAKQILLYSKDVQMQTKIESLGFGGRIVATDRDYLAVINSNLGGTKTDLEVKQKLRLVSKILSDGSVLNTLQIRRENQSGEANRDYMRVLVPKGSQLISVVGADEGQHNASESTGFKTDPDLVSWDVGRLHFGRVYERVEADKTEFAFWLNLEAEQRREVKLVYLLPLRINPSIFGTDTYSLMYQTQSGSKPSLFEAQFDFGSLKRVWNSGKIDFQDNAVKFDYWGNSDQYWAIVFSK